MSFGNSAVDSSRAASRAPGVAEEVPAIRLRNLSKTFGSKNFNETKAVDGVDLDIRQGEFFSMLGPRDRARPPCCGSSRALNCPRPGLSSSKVKT
ncbi:hypothetical protein [Arthrobacter psychrolactophilus]